MIKQLIKLANELDKKGLRKEADYLDSLLKKTAGRDEGMWHEEHAQSLEAPGADAAELQESHERTMVDARKVAEWIVGGTPVFGPDADTDIDELTDILSADDHETICQYDVSITVMPLWNCNLFHGFPFRATCIMSCYDHLCCI